MRRKYKICITSFIITIISLTILFVLLALDTLQQQFYGLSYNQIISNYTSNAVYQTGIYYVGVSAYFIKIYKTPQLLKLGHTQQDKMKTFTSDFYDIQISVTIVYQLTLPTKRLPNATSADDFNFLAQYYRDFGQSPELILKPLFKNEIIQIVSQYNSSYYTQGQSIYLSLESIIQTNIKKAVQRWTSMNIQVLIQSLISKGINRNAELYNRKISALKNRVQTIVPQQNIQLTGFMNATIQNTKSRADNIFARIVDRANMFRKLIISSSSNTNLGMIIFGNEIFSKNLSFASSQQRFRPQLYIITNTTQF